MSAAATKVPLGPEDRPAETAGLPLFRARPYAERWTLRMVRERSEVAGVLDGDRMRGPADVARLFHAMHADEVQEVFVAFYLNSRHRIIGHSLLTRGTIDASLISPREVFRVAILSNASAVIVVHNHPSGDPSPSPDDRAVTRQLVEAGRTLGIPVLDHLICTHDLNRFVSLAEEGGM